MNDATKSLGVHGPIERLLGRLNEQRAISRAALQRAERAASLSSTRIDQVLVKLGLVEEHTLLAAWSATLELPAIARENVPQAPVLRNELAPQFLRHAGALPIGVSEEIVALAVTDPLDRFSPAAVAAKTRRAVRVMLMAKSLFDEAFQRLYPDCQPAPGETLASENSNVAANDVTTLRDLAGDSPAIRLANAIIEKAVGRKASDIHISVSRNGARLRYRIDGILQDVDSYPLELHSALIARFKVLAELDIAETRRPQDGRIRIGIGGREIDLRVATMPHLEGEGVVLRILDRSAVRLELAALGFQGSLEQQLSTLLSQPHGILLVTGPTGSGKTTTLYAALRQLAQPERNVISVEDPVEYHVDGVAQIQVHHKIGLDFPTILRSVLRQDPDVIMVGEIRDRETAAIANQAALTGHFVLATLHTNSASAALPRLIDMGVEPYLLSSTIRAALSQRLVRSPCQHCGEYLEASKHREYATLRKLAETNGIALSASRPLIRTCGCSHCHGTGFAGRVAIGELMLVDDPMREALLARADAERLEAIAKDNGLVPLVAAGLRAVMAGTTTPNELVRVVGQAVVA
jgi:general secretion pathway protein E